MRPSTSSSVTPCAREHVLGDGGPHEAALDVELGGGERLAEQLEVREAVLLEQLARTGARPARRR